MERKSKNETAYINSTISVKTAQEKVTILTLRKMKEERRKVVCITAYDYPLSLLAERAGVDIILVGDSLGMTTLGYKTTLSVTMEDMIRHASAVRRAVSYAFVIGDMPYMSYQPSDRDAVINAGRFIAEACCDAVKCEGGKRIAPRVKAMVDAGIVVQGHIGLTPQSIGQLGGFRVQGKTRQSYDLLLEDALILQAAGVFSIVFEGMPSEVAERIKKHLKIPVYGIGAGDKLDGQIVIIHDLIGLFEEFRPKFVKRYCDADILIANAIGKYANDVRTGKFPSQEHFYPMEKEEWEKIKKGKK